MIKVGDKKQFVPAEFSNTTKIKDPATGKQVVKSVVGRVVYVHPTGRFYTVEATVGDHVFRESFLKGESDDNE